MLRHLTPMQQRIVDIIRDAGGAVIKAEEVGRRLGITKNNVAVQIHKARQRGCPPEVVGMQNVGMMWKATPHSEPRP